MFTAASTPIKLKISVAAARTGALAAAAALWIALDGSSREPAPCSTREVVSTQFSRSPEPRPRTSFDCQAVCWYSGGFVFSGAEVGRSLSQSLSRERRMREEPRRDEEDVDGGRLTGSPFVSRCFSGTASSGLQLF